MLSHNDGIRQPGPLGKNGERFGGNVEIPLGNILGIP